MTADDLLIYIALIRSVLEYCCPVWHTNLPSYLSEQIERLQKRVLKIIFQSLSYKGALSAADCVRLDDNRQRLCLDLQCSNFKLRIIIFIRVSQRSIGMRHSMQIHWFFMQIYTC